MVIVSVCVCVDRVKEKETENILGNTKMATPVSKVLDQNLSC